MGLTIIVLACWLVAGHCINFGGATQNTWHSHQLSHHIVDTVQQQKVVKLLHLCTIMDVQIMIQRWRNTHIVLWKYFQDRKIDHSKTIIGDTKVWNGTKNFIGSVFRLFLVFSFILTASLALSCRFNSIHRISLLKIIIYIKCKLLWPTAVIILNMLKKTFCFISSPS